MSKDFSANRKRLNIARIQHETKKAVKLALKRSRDSVPYAVHDVSTFNIELTRALSDMVAAGMINDARVRVLSVRAGNVHAIEEVDVPSGTLPGDPVFFSDGQYKGTVVSVDPSTQRGTVVNTAHAQEHDSNTIEATISVGTSVPAEYVEMRFVMNNEESTEDVP